MASGKQYVTFVHAPTQPIHDLLASGQRVRHFLASGQRVHNFSSWGQRVRHFLVQGLSSPRPKGKEASKASLFRTRARSSFSAMPKVSHAARRAHGARRAPWGWGGREGGCAEGAPLRDISSLNQYISLTPIGAPPAGAHRTHKLYRNINEEQFDSDATTRNNKQGSTG